MHVEQYGYWRDVEFEALNCLNDSAVIVAIFNQKESLPTLIHRNIFDMPPADKFTLIDAANIISHSGFRRAELSPVTSDWRNEMIMFAAQCLVHDVITVIDEVVEKFKESGVDEFRDFLNTQYKPQPCSTGGDEVGETLSLLHLWNHHVTQVSMIDSSFQDSLLGKVKIPPLYGMGFCSPTVKAFVGFDKYIRKKLPRLVGKNREELNIIYQELMKVASLT